MRGRAPGPGRLEKRGTQWVLTWTDAQGARRRRALGTDKRVAERRRAELVAQRDMELDGLGSVQGLNRTLTEIQNDYLADLQLRVTPRHFGGVRDRLARMLTALGDARVRDLRVMDVVRVRNQMKVAGASNRTCDTYTGALKAMLTWAVDAGLIAANPLAGLKRLPGTKDHQVYRRRALTEDEIERLLEASEAEDAELAILSPNTRVPQTPLWMALLEVGARYGELTRATWGDLDSARRVLVLRAENTKSRKQRAVPLSEGLVDRLVAVRALHETVLGRLPNVADRIFLSPEGRPMPAPTTNAMRIFDRLLDRTGIAKVNLEGRKLDIHALRTTRGSQFGRQGVPLAIAQRWLGHSDPKLTAQHYTDLGVEDLRAAVDRLPGMPGQAKEAR